MGEDLRKFGFKKAEILNKNFFQYSPVYHLSRFNEIDTIFPFSTVFILVDKNHEHLPAKMKNYLKVMEIIEVI